MVSAFRLPSVFMALTMLVTGAAPATTFAARRPAEVPVALWPIDAPLDAGPAVHEAWTRLEATVDALPTLTTDGDRLLTPYMRRSEGREVALHLAARRLGAAWAALSRGESESALALVADAEGAAAGFSPSELPEGWLRDFVLIRVRAWVQRGDQAQAMAVLRGLLTVDPGYQPSPRFEQAATLTLFEQLAEERRMNGRGQLVASAPALGMRLLVQGVDQGELLGEIERELPVGEWQVCGRKVGYADDCRVVRIRPNERAELVFEPRVENSMLFQDALAAALIEPRAQRGSAVWEALRLASDKVGSRAILTGRVENAPGHEAVLVVGLYVAGREGWALYRRLPLQLDPKALDVAVDDTAADIGAILAGSLLAAR